MNKIINLAIVDDEVLILEGISLLFSNVGHINVVVKAQTGLELLDEIAEIQDADFPDIALIDIQMKPMDGFDLVEALRIKYPDLKIIILSSHYKSNVLGHMIKLGVSAFIPKNSKKEALLKAIESVHATGVFFTRRDQDMLMTFMKSKSKQPTLNNEPELSSREIDVLKLICQEYTNQQVADQLFISKRTVESHRQRILEKIGAKNTVGLVVYAVANNIHPIS